MIISICTFHVLLLLPHVTLWTFFYLLFFHLLRFCHSYLFFFYSSNLIPVNNYLPQVNKRESITIFKICSKLTIKEHQTHTSMITKLPVFSLVTLSISPQCLSLDYYKLSACICFLRVRCSIHLWKTWFLHALCN